MTYTYQPRGVCSRKMTVQLQDGIIRDVRVEGGCNGNLQGISRLVIGMPAPVRISYPLPWSRPWRRANKGTKCEAAEIYLCGFIHPCCRRRIVWRAMGA